MTSSEITKQLLEAPNGVIAMGSQSSNEDSELRRIELAARTCYKSEDKITDTSHIELFNMLVSRKHFAMLRFGERTVKLSIKAWADIKQRLILTRTLQYWRWSQVYGGVIVTSNFNSWLLLYTYVKYNPTLKNIILNVFKSYPVMTKALTDIHPYKSYDLDDVVVEVTNIPFQLRRFCFRVITDRGITHEIVRHTTLSYAQESTRYVNYKSKETMAYIPDYIKEKGLQDIFLDAFDTAIANYQKLVDTKILKPQDARGLLPHCLKTEICISGYYDYDEEMPEFQQGFSHFIAMRATKEAHLGIRPIALSMKEYFDTLQENED